MNNLIYDQHVHSHFSMDSTASLESYFQKAISFGWNHFVTTEHIDYDIAPTHVNWLVDFDGLREELALLQKKYPEITPLLGVELGYRKEYTSSLHQLLKKYPFDVVNLSIHGNGKVEYYYYDFFEKYGVKEVLENYFKELLEGVSAWDDFDVLSHFDYGFKTAYQHDSSLSIKTYEEILTKIFQKLIEKNKALEINTKVQIALPVDHLNYVLQLYKKLGGKKLTLSSDAHQVSRLGANFKQYQQIIKQNGFDTLCYFIQRKEYHFHIEEEK